MSTAITTPGSKPENIFKKAIHELVERARGFEKIETVEQFTAVGTLFNEFAGAIKKLKAHYDPKIADARVPYQNLLDEKGSLLDVLEDKKKFLDRLMTAWDHNQKRLVAERQRQAEADQKEADQIAEAERLQAEGKDEEALAVLEGKQPVPVSQSFTPAPVVRTETPKVRGLSGRKRWKARLNPKDSGIKFPDPVPEELQVVAKMELIKAVAAGMVSHFALDVNAAYLNTEGNTKRELLGYPGVESFEDTSWSGRG